MLQWELHLTPQQTTRRYEWKTSQTNHKGRISVVQTVRSSCTLYPPISSPLQGILSTPERENTELVQNDSVLNSNEPVSSTVG